MQRQSLEDCCHNHPKLVSSSSSLSSLWLSSLSSSSSSSSSLFSASSKDTQQQNQKKKQQGRRIGKVQQKFTIPVSITIIMTIIFSMHVKRGTSFPISAYATNSFVARKLSSFSSSSLIKGINIQQQESRGATKSTFMTTTTNRYTKNNNVIRTWASYTNTDNVDDEKKQRQQEEEEEKSIILDPLVVCGPSGVGKGTIITKFMEELGGNGWFGFSVSHTTRQPRPGEIDGIHYHFVTESFMKEHITNKNDDDDNGYFLEYAKVHDNYYGTSWQSLRDVQEQEQSTDSTKRKRCLLDIDVQGVQTIKEMAAKTQKNNLSDITMILQPKYIFIAPPSLEVLQQRLMGRGTESDESFQRRTANAKRELEYGLTDGNFDAIVVNQDLDFACNDFLNKVKTLYNIPY